MNRIVRTLITLLVVAAVAGGGYWYYRNHTKTAVAASSSSTYSQTVAVKQGNLSSTVTVVGQMEATQSAGLAFERMTSTAKLQSLAVKAGSTVTTGQVLATIDATPYQAALDQAKTALQASQQNLTDLTAKATTLDIAEADVTIAKAEQALIQAKADLADITAPDLTSLQDAVTDAEDAITLVHLQITSAGSDALAKSERDLSYTVSWYQRRIADLEALSNPNLEQTTELAKDRTSLASVQTDLARVQLERELARRSKAAELVKDKIALTTAETALATAKAGGDKLALAQAQVAVQNSDVLLQTAQKARADLVAGTDATTVATAQADVDKKKLAVSDAEAALADTKLVATFDGTVLKTNVSVGDQVSAATAIMTVANLKTVQVAASVDETTIKRVSAGQDATITFDAFAGQTFTGKVGAVPLQGSLQGGVTVYVVPVSLVGADKVTLLVGMTANVKIQAGSATNALLVPTMALTKANGQYQVMVPNTADPAGAPETVTVQVGLSDGTYTQITKGLNVGDQVVVQVKSTASTTAKKSTGIFSSLTGMFGRR